VLRRILIVSALLGVLAGPAGAQPAGRTLLMPGVTFERVVDFTLHGPVVINVIEGPKPTGLYSLQPVLAKGSVQGRERLTSMQKDLSPTATVAGVNGDLFSSSGGPNGLFLQDGVLQTAPLGSRSTLGVDAAGNVSVGRVGSFGDWRGTGPRWPLKGLNEPPGTGGASLFTPSWGSSTPAAADAVEVVLSPFPATTPNSDLVANVTQVLHGGNHPIPGGSAILLARGNSATRLTSEAPVGTAVTVRMILPSPFSSAVDGIGGGPVLVRGGRPVFRSFESFASSWLVPRLPRTAIGQLADGRILLVAVDGSRPGYSSGMTNFELAQEMAQLGAVTAMGLDASRSTAMAFDGGLLNRPIDPSGERPIADGLMLLYVGVQTTPPSAPVISPSGGVPVRTGLSYKVVRPSTVTAELVGPDGTATTVDSGRRDPGTYRFTWTGLDSTGKLQQEGKWTWRVTAVDDLGRSSEADRPVSLNTTLSGLAVQPAILPHGGSVRIGVDLKHPAKLTVTVEAAGGVVLRTLSTQSVSTSHVDVTWDGRLGSRAAHPGTYFVHAVAKNQYGEVDLTQPIKARR
jgi:hypothetical protein